MWCAFKSPSTSAKRIWLDPNNWWFDYQAWILYVAACYLISPGISLCLERKDNVATKPKPRVSNFSLFSGLETWSSSTPHRWHFLKRQIHAVESAMEKSMENREKPKEQQGTEAGSLKCSCLFLEISTLTTDRGSKRAERRTEEVASRHLLKCSRVYRKQLRKGKEKQPPIPQIHTTDGIPFTSRRDSATNSSFWSLLCCLELRRQAQHLFSSLAYKQRGVRG